MPPSALYWVSSSRFRKTPVYQARTSVEIVGLNDNSLNIKESDPLNENNASVDPVDIQTQIKILQSESLVDAVLLKLKSGHVPVSETQRASGWRKMLNLPGAEAVDSREKSATYAAHHYKVKASGPTRIIEITVDSMNPQLATEFANMLTTEYIDQNLESRSHMTQHTSEWLARQLDDMRVRLEHSEDGLQAYARQAGLLFTGDQKNNVSEEKLLQLQQALSAAQTDRISKQSRWEMANSGPAETSRRSQRFHASRVSVQADRFAAPDCGTRTTRYPGVFESAETRSSAGHYRIRAKRRTRRHSQAHQERIR